METLRNRAVNLTLCHRFEREDVAHDDGFALDQFRVIAFMRDADERIFQPERTNHFAG